jgi:hypothetical protein
LISANVKWPAFELRDAQPLKTRDIALEAVAQRITERTPHRHDVRQADSRLVYWLNEDDLRYEPAIVTDVIWKELDDSAVITPPDLEVVYSLYDGVVTR